MPKTHLNDTPIQSPYWNFSSNTASGAKKKSVFELKLRQSLMGFQAGSGQWMLYVLGPYWYVFKFQNYMLMVYWPNGTSHAP